MAVQTTSVRTTLAGNGSATVFPFPFHCTDPATISVVYTDPGGARVTLSPAAYSVTLNAPPADGGWVTYPLSGSPIPVGSSLTISRTVPLTQDVELTNQSGFYPSVINGALDRLAMVDQQLAEEQGRAIRLPAPETVAPLPDAATRRNKLLVFDSAGNPAVAPIPGAGASMTGDATLATVLPSGTSHAATLGELLSYSVSPQMFGANGDGIADDTAEIQAAIDTGRPVYFPRGTYRITGPLRITKDGQRLFGEGAWAATLKPEGSGYDVITFGTAPPATVIRGGGMEGIRIDGAGHSNGATIRVLNSSRMHFKAVHTVSCWNAWDIARINGCHIEDSTNEDCRGDFILRWYGDEEWRSDLLRLVGFTGSASAGSSIVGIEWDGNCHTLQLQSCNFVQVGYGIRVRNTAGASKPMFLMADDLEVDFPTYDGVRLETGEQFYFSPLLYLHGSASGSGIYVGPSVTGGGVVIVTGGKITGHARYGIENAVSVRASSVYYQGNTLGDVSGTSYIAAARFQLDATAYLNLASGVSPTFAGDSNDYLQFNRSVNEWLFVVNGSAVLKVSDGKIGFFGANPVAKPTVTGSLGGNAALASLLSALAALGLITNNTTT